MKGMKERLAKKIKLITIVSTLKQGLAHHRNNVDRTIHHLKEEIFAESGQNRGCVTPTLLELEEDVEEQEQEHDLQEEEREILLEFEENCPPGGEDSINHRVKYKERDVSMDSEFRDQMWRLLGAKVTSPRLFVRGRYIGGADEVVALNENGKLKKLLEGISLVDSPCECCKNERFLICSSCNGSSRLIVEHHDEEETSNDSKMWTRCRECNENGLVKCPLCS
ncbi:BnaA03g55390D [Brassica napus]|uniref:BnaA03g55390D protein n=1 Tax=Brassica napus TaxID=3708 RepID=A0A078IVY3_BRANA|nr:BnaA03g55390D [Brassica napus]